MHFSLLPMNKSWLVKLSLLFLVFFCIIKFLIKYHQNLFLFPTESIKCLCVAAVNIYLVLCPLSAVIFSELVGLMLIIVIWKFENIILLKLVLVFVKSVALFIDSRKRRLMFSFFICIIWFSIKRRQNLFIFTVESIKCLCVAAVKYILYFVL